MDGRTGTTIFIVILVWSLMYLRVCGNTATPDIFMIGWMDI